MRTRSVLWREKIKGFPVCNVHKAMDHTVYVLMTNAETKWPPFCRPYFQRHFLEEKMLELHSFFKAFFVRLQFTISQYWFG